MLVLNIEGRSTVQVVRLDDPSPGYAARYAAAVARFIDTPGARLRYCEVDVTTVAEHGPDTIARMLTASRDECLTDLPQEWERIEC